MARRLLSAVAVLALLGQPAYAWNKPGHMVTGALAYMELKQHSPETIAKVVEILEKHPQFDRWEDLIDRLNIADEDRDLFLFMQAARWPDDARGTQFDRPSQHFVNIPFKPGESGSPAIPGGDNIFVGFFESVDVLDSDAPDSEKAVALCWIFHLVGDVHQPLHTAKLVTAKFPEPIGDRGGTRFFIKAKAGASTISLHQLWDGFITGSQNFQTVRNVATELRNRSDFDRASLGELSEKDFGKWATDESFEIAKKDAYRDGALKGGTTKADGKVLPAGYLDAAQPIAQRRCVLAGYRLADLLKEKVD